MVEGLFPRKRYFLKGIGGRRVSLQNDEEKISIEKNLKRKIFLEYEIKLNRKHNKENVPVAKMLRKCMTPEEKKLWYRFLSKYPVRFKKQKPFGPFVLDFYCAEANLVIELDGSQHSREWNKKLDDERTYYIEQYGIKVIRYNNSRIRNHFLETCEEIDKIVKQRIEEKNHN